MSKKTAIDYSASSNRRSLQHKPFEALQPRKKYKYPVPQPLNSDYISSLSDDDLGKLRQKLSIERDVVASTMSDRYSNDSTPWEVELSYIQREYDMRERRYTLHNAYMRLLDEDGDPLPLPGRFFDHLLSATSSETQKG